MKDQGETPTCYAMRETTPSEMLRRNARTLHDRAHDYEQLADALDRLILQEGAAQALRFILGSAVL